MSDDLSFPRVLFITPHAFNKSTGTGVTFTNLFAGWPRDRIATVHDDSVPVSTDVCSRYYALTASEIRRLDFGISALFAGRPRGPMAAVARPTGSREGVAIKVRRLIFGDGLPQTGVLTPALAAWIVAFKPDLIFTILGSIGLMTLIGEIQRRFALPLIVHMMDDWPSAQFRTGLLAPLQKRRMERLVRRLIDRATVRMGICDAMCRAFDERYGRPFLPFQNTVDTSRWGPQEEAPGELNDPVRLVYAGSVLPHAQLDSLADCCQAVAGLARSGHRIQLDIFGPESLIDFCRSRLEVHPSIHIHGPLTEDASFFATLRGADILLMPSNFDSDTVRFIRYSMPTRVPAYLASGTPILVYGSPDVAQVAYAEELGWGLVIPRRGVSSVQEGILRLIEDRHLRQGLSAAALRTARERHDADIVRRRFRETIAAVAGAPA